MINAIIIDDEPINISNLAALIQKHCEGITIVATASNVHDATTQILAHQPDVVFLDIEMPEKNGFELLKSLGPINFEVVFVTAYDSYGLIAIKFSALDYLLKPIAIATLK
jgi:two-component system LytT family response regulator